MRFRYAESSRVDSDCVTTVTCICFKCFITACVPGAKVVGAVVAAPIVVGLAAGAVGLFAAIAAIVAPTYGSYKLARLIHQRLNEDKFD